MAIPHESVEPVLRGLYPNPQGWTCCTAVLGPRCCTTAQSGLTDTAFPRYGNSESLLLCARSLLLPAHRHWYHWAWQSSQLVLTGESSQETHTLELNKEFVHLISPKSDFSEPLCQGKAVPLSIFLCMILLSLPHFFIWDAGLVAGRTGWLLNASSI